MFRFLLHTSLSVDCFGWKLVGEETSEDNDDDEWHIDDDICGVEAKPTLYTLAWAGDKL